MLFVATNIMRPFWGIAIRFGYFCVVASCSRTDMIRFTSPLSTFPAIRCVEPTVRHQRPTPECSSGLLLKKDRSRTQRNRKFRANSPWFEVLQTQLLLVSVKLFQAGARVSQTYAASGCERLFFKTTIQIDYFKPKDLAFLKPSNGDCVGPLVFPDTVTDRIFDERLQNQRGDHAVPYVLVDQN